MKFKQTLSIPWKLQIFLFPEQNCIMIIVLTRTFHILIRTCRFCVNVVFVKNSSPVNMRFKRYCFEVVLQDVALVQSPLGKNFQPVYGILPTQYHGNLDSYLFVAIIPVQKVNNDWHTQRTDHMTSLNQLDEVAGDMMCKGKQYLEKLKHLKIISRKLTS